MIYFILGFLTSLILCIGLLAYFFFKHQASIMNSVNTLTKENYSVDLDNDFWK